MKRSRAELARLADVISGFKAKPADNSGELQDQINKLNHLNAHLRLALSTLNKEKVVLEAKQKKADALIGSALEQIDHALAAETNAVPSQAPHETPHETAHEAPSEAPNETPSQALNETNIDPLETGSDVRSKY
ncbi:hypothetical protein OA101_04100 [Alphaproteobacteria bacterium]|jgi:hypothetical protein|nr:hypothetical protein [Alphaproteobacteria bacterium]